MTRADSNLEGTSNGSLSKRLAWSGILFALVFPTLITWAYFVLAGRYSTGIQQATYLVVKTIQFAFPLFWVLVVLQARIRFNRPRADGLLIGAAFSIAVVGAGWLVFNFVLRDSAVFSGVAPLVNEKVGGFGVDSLWKYAALAAFYSLFHSLLEEYYWRWFVFGQLRRVVRLWPAILISSLGFMSHHVVVLGEFFQQTPWIAWLLASAVALGGVFWAWLYERTGSLLGPWLSHLLIDAGIFWIGYDMVRDAMQSAG